MKKEQFVQKSIFAVSMTEIEYEVAGYEAREINTGEL